MSEWWWVGGDAEDAPLVREARRLLNEAKAEVERRRAVDELLRTVPTPNIWKRICIRMGWLTDGQK